MASYAISYDSSGNPINGYLVDSSGDIQVILPIPLFVVSVSPTSITVAHGSPGTTTVSVAVSSPFSSKIKLSASGLPAGATAKFSPASIAAPGSGSSTMTIKAAATTPTGTYPVTITGTAEGAITQTAALSVVVVAESAASAFEAPDEFGHSTLLLLVGDEPAAERPLKSACETCDRYCDKIGDVAGVACALLTGALCTPLGAGAAGCAIAGGGLCFILTKQNCIENCQYAECTPPECNSDNCPPPAMCQQGVCVQVTCSPGDVACSGYCCGANDICCDGFCCTETWTCCPGFGCCQPNCSCYVTQSGEPGCGNCT